MRVRVTCGRAERGMECCWCGQTTKRVHAAGQAMHIVAAKKAKARGIVMPPTREEPPNEMPPAEQVDVSPRDTAHEHERGDAAAMQHAHRLASRTSRCSYMRLVPQRHTRRPRCQDSEHGIGQHCSDVDHVEAKWNHSLCAGRSSTSASAHAGHATAEATHAAAVAEQRA